MSDQLYTLGEVVDRLQLREVAIDTVQKVIIWFNPETNRLEYKDDDNDPIVIVFNTDKVKQGDRVFKIYQGLTLEKKEILKEASGTIRKKSENLTVEEINEEITKIDCKIEKIVNNYTK